MSTPTPPDNENGTEADNVIDFFSGKRLSELENSPFIRLAPELDGLEMLYSNKAHPGKFFALKILCWGLRDSGEVVGLVPWMTDIAPCTEIEDPQEGQFEGYYDPGIDEIFFEPPEHKIIELESSAEYYQFHCTDPQEVLQEIPDNIGTHAVLNSDRPNTLMLTEVISWQLQCNGNIHAMLVDADKCHKTPVLPGDECLYSAQEHADFRYFFQHTIANKLKEQDPEAMAAVAALVEKNADQLL
jgi:hypothetical protein